VFFLDASMAMCRLAQLLDVELDLFATEAPLSAAAYRAAALNKKPSLPSLEELAVPHVALIRSRQTSGPCLLAGHSFCGLLAFEVAHQLRREGINVELVLLVDTILTTLPLWYRIERLNLARARSAVTRRLTRLWIRAARIGGRVLPGSVSPGDLQAAPCDQPFIELPSAIKARIYGDVFETYERRPLQGHGLLLQATENELLGPRLTIDSIIGWKGLFTGGLEIIETPGDHVSLLELPQVNVLAAKVSERLARYAPKALQSGELVE
jgi:thioesterase domain-containing protein